MNVCYSVYASDRPGLLRDVASCVAAREGNIDGVRHVGGETTELHLDVSGASLDGLEAELTEVEGVQRVEMNASASSVFGKRLIVLGGGAQVAMVVQGAVSEADRHNIRGERISVDTMPVVGEARLAEAVRAVGRLPRVAALVLAGSLMGGDVARAVTELRARGIPVVCLNMAGSVPDVADLVVTDPVQAGVMAVMAIAETAKFDLARVRGRRF
ncbi:hypothetical protein EON79_20880 [bacterium]|nr:MAG: hypothetical protein EON79_20880 [bacterium]